MKLLSSFMMVGFCTVTLRKLQISSDRNTPISEVCEHFVESEPSIVSTSLDMQVREEQNVGAAQNLVCPSSSKPSAWEARHVDAPGVPECYTKVAESKFPIQVEEFFDLFVSDDGINFQESFHRKCGDKDFKCTTWRPHDKFGHTRDVSFQHPIKIYFGSRFGSCQEVQKYRVYRNSHLIVETSQEITDVPYGDYFSVEGRWDVEKDSSGSTPGCILRVYTSVAFSKKTMWKGKIVQSTVEECREAYAICIDHAHEVLKQKKLEKEVGRASDLLISDEQVRLEDQANTVNYVEVSASDMRVSQIIPDMNDVNERVTGPPRGNISKASVGSVVEDIFVKLSTSLRHQSMPSLLLIITVAIILLLMQMSVLVLLNRPQRIHVIQHADSTSSVHGVAGESRSEETITLLNKQIKYLKEEMHFMETLLEKMQHEHALLKGKLKDLELFRNQRV
ncbi:hypothetical protein ACJIZ3_007795 [Penstemon smallii]|uniref:VASt domain-containing protein n=1 Tax=Penstemon smallii TaxID=265156 RepID=A0ABD3T7Y9_9LAMI